METLASVRAPRVHCLLAGLAALALQGCWSSDPPPSQATAAAPAPAVAGPAAAEVGIDAEGALHVGEQDRCPVCAMRCAEHPKFSCGMELSDGRTFYFCGTGCLIRTWLHPEVYLKAGAAGVERMVVRDYFTGAPVDATAVTWVAGSDVVGPMGPALVPIADAASVAVFTRRHGGEVTFRLAEVDDARWKEITGKDALPKGTR